MIWIPMSVAILLYLLRVSKGLALPLGLWLHHMNIMDVVRKRAVKLRKHVYHLQIPAFLMVSLNLKLALKHKYLIWSCLRRYYICFEDIFMVSSESCCISYRHVKTKKNWSQCLKSHFVINQIFLILKIQRRTRYVLYLWSSLHKSSSAAVSVGCSCKFKFVLI